MPVTPLTLRPGLVNDVSQSLNEGGWQSGTNIRFRETQAQPLGGWSRAIVASFEGVCRGLHAAAQIDGTKNAWLGTHLKLYVGQGGMYYDITPVRTSGTVSGPFVATSGSQLVTVSQASHGVTAGDRVIFPLVTGNGITISGEYAVAGVTDVNDYTITASSAANATGVFGSSSVAFTYLLPSGNNGAIVGFGWGAGPWGTGSWGTPRTGVTGIALPPRVWSLDNWGEDLIANPRDQGIYRWIASSGTGTRALVISGAPTRAKCVLVGVPERHLLAYGAEVGGVQDPLLLRWASVDSLTDWVATAINSAGSQRLAGGNFLVGAIRSGQQILVWTDAVLYAQQFTGTPYFYSFRLLGTKCGLIATHAACDDSGTGYWMSRAGFHKYDGSIQKLPCTIWADVFRNLNLNQLDKITCGVNSLFDEIWWAWPSNNSTECDSITIFNKVDGTWYGGVGWMQRTAWIDREVFPQPLATDAGSTVSSVQTGTNSGGKMYFHEQGTNSDGAAIVTVLESGYFDLTEGRDFMFWDMLWPDFQFQDGNVYITPVGTDAPNGDTYSSGPLTCTPSTPFVEPRLRARLGKIIVQTVDVDAFYRWGKSRLRAAPDGRNQ